MKIPKHQRKPKKGIPVLRGVLSLTRQGNKIIRVWCPYCDKAHIHGWPDPEAPDWSISHRRPHCLENTPFSKTGYYVGVLPRKFQQSAK